MVFSLMRSWWRTCFTIDLRSLALFRIALGMVVVCDAAVRAVDAEVFYADTGIFPRDPMLRSFATRPVLSVFLLDGSVEFQLALFALTIVAGIALMLGWHARIAAFIGWVLMLGVQARNAYISSGADAVILMFLLWSVFLPTSARFSLDVARAVRKGRVAPVVDPASDDAHAITSGATFALVVQLVAIYIFNVIHKNQTLWWNGNAVLVALHLDGHATPLAIFLREHARWLSAPLTYGTLLGESSPLLLFIPYRNVWLRIFVFATLWTLHISFAACLQLGLFSPACMAGWLAILPAAAWRRRPLARLASWRVWPVASAAGSQSPSIASVARPRRRIALAVSLLAVALILLQVAKNIAIVAKAPLPGGGSGVLERVSTHMRFNQAWRMFSIPGQNDGWYVMPGLLRSGREVDVFHDGAPVTFDKPRLVTDDYPTSRWRRMMMTNWDPKKAGGIRKAHARWICRSWNRTHAGDDALVSFRMIFMLEKTRYKDARPDKPKQLDLLEYTCPTEEP
jgi:hypothetical protein